MNFKPTILKVIGSAVIGCIIGFLFLQPATIKPAGGLLGNGAIGQPLIISDWSSIIAPAIISFVVIYIIWSFFQKKSL